VAARASPGDFASLVGSSLLACVAQVLGLLPATLRGKLARAACLHTRLCALFCGGGGDGSVRRELLIASQLLEELTEITSANREEASVQYFL
jgi:hypothetical protein